MGINFRRNRSASLADVLRKIDQADDPEISEIIQAVIRRYDRKFPDWEVGFLSLHKDPELRQKEIKETMEFLKKYPPK